jgi:hypothetical protein
MTRLIVGYVILCLAGCVRFGDLPRTAMVEVSTAPTPPPPPPQRRPWTLRKAMLTTGLILGSLGVGLVGGGGGAYESERREVEHCHADPNSLCLFDGFATWPGLAMLTFGAGHLVAALVVSVYGFGGGSDVGR